MADGFSTEDRVVAATFAAMELTEKTLVAPSASDAAARAKIAAENFKIIFKAIREAQASD